jgi:hypothetical protein
LSDLPLKLPHPDPLPEGEGEYIEDDRMKMIEVSGILWIWRSLQISPSPPGEGEWNDDDRSQRFYGSGAAFK